MTRPRSAADANADSNRDGERDAPASSLDVTVKAPPVEAAEHLAAWWVALADEQQAYGSHLLGEPNRTLIREAMARHIVTEGLLVARRDPPNDVSEVSEADDGEGIVGFVMFGPETGSYEQSVDRGIVENVYVHPDHRSQGIGTLLLDAAERALAESGVDRVALETMADNEAARRLYARRGYSPHRIELEAPIDRLGVVDRTGNGGRSGGGSEDDRPTDRASRGDRKR